MNGDPSGYGRGGALPPLPPEFDPRGRHRGAAAARPPHRNTGFVLLLKILSAALSVLLIVYIGYLWTKFHDLNHGLHRLQVTSLGQDAAKHHKSFYDIDGKDENLLIVGNDDRADMTPAERQLLHTGHDQSLSTDTMMIVHVPADGSKATLISLPRDSYVHIPGYGMDKLNSAYAHAYTNASGSLDAKRAAGGSLLVQTVENLTGLTIDHYVQVGLIGFYRIAKAIGGVPVNLCHAVNDTHAHNVATGQDGGSGFKMSAGKHTLNAVQALEFVRQRHNLPNGDLDRTARQRYFLTAAFRKIASAGTLLSPGRLTNLVNAVDKSLYVDGSLNILDLARQMANLSANNIVGKAIPFQGFNNNSPVGSVEIVDPARVKRFVNHLIGSGNSAFSSASIVDPSTVTVSVLNGGSSNGAAGRSAAALKKAGFSATAGDSNTPRATTTIEYPNGMESQAKTLAQYVPGAVASQTSSVSGVTLVLGQDMLAAQSTPKSGGGHPEKPSQHKTHKAVDAGCIN